jgi:hypothetical protein
MWQKKLQKYGHKNNKQQYQCTVCKHQFCSSIKKPRWSRKAYQEYFIGKQTLKELQLRYKKSIPTLRKYFDAIEFSNQLLQAPKEPINLILYATFFRRTDGFLIFRANKVNLFWCNIPSETIAVIDAGLCVLDKASYKFKSFTIDGRRGVIKLLQARYPGIPIQLCHFHQTQIIRRYTTNQPKTNCGKELKQLMCSITTSNQIEFQNAFSILQIKYQEFLKERNENRQFVHRKLRSAFRSLKTNLPHLFTHKNYSKLNISNTTNSCDGSFAHWKQKLKIHRGLRKHRRDKMANFLIKNT